MLQFFCVTIPDMAFHKSGQILTTFYWHFLAKPTTACNSPNCDNRAVWPTKHIWKALTL